MRFLKTLNSDYKNLINNFFSLSALQGINMILPLLTLPYLVRVLGVDTFGLINLSLSIIMYFNILISFGFELSATKDISTNLQNPKRIAEIFSSVMIIKFVLFCFSLLLLIILTNFFEVFIKNRNLYLVTFAIVGGNAILPTWFFQGIEKMKHITIITVFSKSLFALLIFIFVESSEDYLMVPIFNATGAILGGLYSIYLVQSKYHISFILPNLKTIFHQLKISYPFFVSRIANDGGRYYATVIIGLIFGNTIVGYFSIVEKLFYSFMSIGAIISQTLYPYMSRTKNIVFFKKILITVLGITVITLIPLIYFNDLLMYYLFNMQSEMLSNIFIIIFIGALFGISSTMLGYPLLAAFGYVKYANHSLIFAALIYVVLLSVATIILENIYLAALSLALYHFSSFVFRMYYIRKIQLFKS